MSMFENNDSNNDQLQRTASPQRVLEHTVRPDERIPMNMATQQRQQQQQAAGKPCPYCGAINEPEAMFCAQCGQPISKTTCPHCGVEIDPDADYCEACHHYIRQDVCSFCGSHLSGNEAYCPESCW